MAEVSLAEIATATRAALIMHGAADWVADEMARTVATAEGYGNRICGLYYLESYCQQLRSGRVDGTVEPEITHPRPGIVAVDARFGFAQTAFLRALPAGLETARRNGIATIAISHAHTCTAVGYFCEQVAREGLLCLGMTNASPIVAPPGGKTRVIGTNPIAFAVPDGQGGVAMQFDQSTSQVALGRITMANAAGQDIPEGWAVDAEGAPTTDPAAALKGSLASAGGYKGWGFGLMAEILASAMTGSTPSRDVAPLKAPEGAPHDLGQYFILIDPAVQPGFSAAMAGLAAAVARDEGARMPGQGKRAHEPVQVPDALWAQVLALSGTGPC